PADRTKLAVRRVPGTIVADVAAFGFRPECDVLGVEGESAGSDDGRIFHLLPTAAVTRYKREEPASLMDAGQGLEPLGRRHIGSRVEKRAEVVAVRGCAGKNDVVALRPVDLANAKLGVNPVVT